jgi:hypothetical protein
MLCKAEIDMAKSDTPDDVDDFLDNAAWKFVLPIIQYLKPHQVQLFWTRHALQNFIHS